MGLSDLGHTSERNLLRKLRRTQRNALYVGGHVPDAASTRSAQTVDIANAAIEIQNARAAKGFKKGEWVITPDDKIARVIRVNGRECGDIRIEVFPFRRITSYAAPSLTHAPNERIPPKYRK